MLINYFKRLHLLGLGGLLVAMLFSCSESNGDDNEYADWQSRNDAYFESVYNQADAAIKSGDNATWKIVRCYSKSSSTTKKTDYIVVKVLNKGEGTVNPIYSDSVYVHYRGNLMPSTTYPAGYQFDSSWTGNYNLSTMTPCVAQTGSFVDGFATALLNMHVGDRWQVYIPYALGYGSTDKSSAGLPAYSTLVFDMTLAKIKGKK